MGDGKLGLGLPRCVAPVPGRTPGRRTNASPSKPEEGQTPWVSSDFVCRGESGAGNPTGSLKPSIACARLGSPVRAKEMEQA